MSQRLFSFLFLSFFASGLFAQQIVPLEGYDFLGPTAKELSGVVPNQLTSQQESDCNNLVPEGVLQLLSGDSINIRPGFDTTDFPQGSSYFCLNCEELNAGSLLATSERVTYFSETGIDQALDTLDLAYCTPNADSCGIIETVIVLVQRAPLVFNFPTEVLAPQERAEINVPSDVLPGGLGCRTFIDCDDDYLGTEQLTLFLNGQNQNNDFRYQAARYAGTDQVCLQLCNSLGLCDQYNYFFEIVRPSVDLPFFDDFSNEGNRPRLELWQNEDVLVNRNYAINPPSLGVATFDAVGPRGQPTGGGSSEFSPRDYLTSASINLAGANNPTISFFHQARGLGNRPERGDSLSLEFLHPDGSWRYAWSTRGRNPGEGSCTDLPFSQVLVDIPPVYAYDGFQFRFFNYSNESGALDHWHLGYVKLDDASGANQANLRDIALNQSPAYVTAPYSAMPYRQLAAAGAEFIKDTFPVGVWNHDGANDALPAGQSNLIISDESGQSFLGPVFFEGLSAVPNGIPFMTSERPAAVLFDPYVQEILGLDNSGGETYRFNIAYQLDPGSFPEITTPGYAEKVTANNTAMTTTVLGNYYAYDDGTAELSVATLPDQTLVQRYEAFTEEVLRGVSIRLPRISTTTNNNLSIELVVFLGELVDGSAPDYSMTVNPIYVETFYSDSLDGYTSYAFPDSIDIPVGPFYVGWRQLGTCTRCLPVGLDRSTIIPGTRFFRNFGDNDWFPFDGCSTGALMVRPLVGDSPIPVTSVAEREQSVALVSIAPNPARDWVKLSANEGVDDNQLRWELLNLAGQSLQSGYGAQIDLSAQPTGLYMVRVLETSTGRFSVHKLIVE